jgi:chromosomal replication initiation ATPase DnaA
LALEYAESFAREDFVAGESNAAALAMIDRWPDWPDSILVLAGEEGSGKSHLASVWAAAAGARIVAARSLERLDLPGALATGALVVEDISPSTDEHALFHLLNLAREENASLLLTTRRRSLNWLSSLPDLTSRLRALPMVQIAPPDDALLRALIIKLAADRQIEVDDRLVSYLSKRIERSFAGVRAAITALDEEALRQQRPVSRPLATEILRGRSN